MITIECTEEEKENLIRVFDYSESCLFMGHDEIICEIDDKTCHKCYNKNIIWKIKND